MCKIQKGYDLINKSFRLPEETVKKLDKLAYKNNLSLNKLVIQCLNYALDNLESYDSDNNERETP